MHRRSLTLALVRALLLVAPVAAQGQVVAPGFAGRVLEVGTEHPVVGATVVLIDGVGNRIAGGFTDEAGSFRLPRLPVAGHRVLVERLGYEVLESSIDGGDGNSDVVFVLVPRPVALDALTVTSDAVCELNPGEGDRTYRLWEATRTGLRAAALSQELGLVRFRIAEWIREVNERGVVRESVHEATREVTGRPFRAAAPELLASEGYLRISGDSTVAYGPDAEVILSDSFLNTHCFRIENVSRSDGWVGLAFEPVGLGLTVDVAGVLWVDGSTGELRALEYDYVIAGLPHAAGSGGAMEFRRLEEGPWIVDRWWIRSRAETRASLPLFREGGGEVLEVIAVSG